MELQVGTEPEPRSAESDCTQTSDLRRLECALAKVRAREAELEAELAAQARAHVELIQLVSHELRTPITVISGFGRLLKSEAQGALAELQHHYVDECLKACSRLDLLVSDLLDACPETGSPLRVAIAEADLHGILTAQTESLAPLAGDRGIEIERAFGAETSRLFFDARRIEQVVSNLLTNAIRHAREGGTICLSTASAARAEGAVVEVSIEDDGPGISAVDRDRVFAPYVRGEGQKARAGLGLGLAICSRIIGAHGGTIHVEESKLGGACFVFALPSEVRPEEEG